jgi:hypothetical protein
MKLMRAVFTMQPQNILGKIARSSSSCPCVISGCGEFLKRLGRQLIHGMIDGQLIVLVSGHFECLKYLSVFFFELAPFFFESFLASGTAFLSLFSVSKYHVKLGSFRQIRPKITQYIWFLYFFILLFPPTSSIKPLSLRKSLKI